METPAQRQPNVVVLWGGSWGATIASICARRGPTLQWVRAEVTAQHINENHRNSRYLGSDVVLSETLRATTDFAEAADRADVVVMGVPSHGFRKVPTELASQLRPPLRHPGRAEHRPRGGRGLRGRGGAGNARPASGR
jgi:glycerol-3-phosphate dehydrogenase (NAD(P)+)